MRYCSRRCLQPPNFVLGQAGELRVGIRGQLFRVLELLLAALQIAVDGDDLLEVGPLAAEVGQLAGSVRTAGSAI